MASYSVDYNANGEGFYNTSGNQVNVYGEDFNFLANWGFDTTDGATLIYNQSNSYDLTGFQPGHEVVVQGFRVHREGPGQSMYQYYTFDFLRSSNGSSWSTGWSFNPSCHWDSIDDTQYSWWCVGGYSGIDDDEIRPGYTYYKAHLYSSDGQVDVYSPTFTVSNLSIDSSLHPYGYLWVEGSRLCYTDGTGWELGNNGYGYKHRIAYDSGYSEYVGTAYKGCIRLESNVDRRIYYIDEYGYKRRTYQASNWYNYTSGQGKYVGTGYKGYLWCPGNYDSANNGYGHLCFVNPSGYLMRILNGPPQGYE